MEIKVQWRSDSFLLQNKNKTPKPNDEHDPANVTGNNFMTR